MADPSRGPDTVAAETDGKRVPREFGLIRYLNMLPFFRLPAERTCVYPVPSALNQGMAEGEVRSGGLSLVAGLRQGLALLGGGYGVASAGAVMSVYLEGLPLEDGGTDPFWQAFAAQQGRFGSADWEAVRSAPAPSEGAWVTILSSGASEQSEWLFSVLLRATGARVRVLSVGAQGASPLSTRYPQELRRLVRSHIGTDEALGFLCIGDEALLRAAKNPLETRCRIDLGAAWQQRTGLPAVFAAWFARAQDPSLLAPLEQAVGSWDAAAPALRLAFARASFPALCQALPESVLSNYLCGLRYRFGREERESIDLMARFHLSGAQERLQI